MGHEDVVLKVDVIIVRQVVYSNLYRMQNPSFYV